MATWPLHDEFLTLHQRIALGDRAIVAIAAHVEVRRTLAMSTELAALGLDDILIGSYARKVSNWPGKDVDVFGRLMHRDVASITPSDAYDAFGRALAGFASQGRLTPQPRSFKVEYDERRTPAAQVIRDAATVYGWQDARVERVIGDLPRVAFEFSVDVVPAVRWGDHYGIPDLGVDVRTGERFRTEQWRVTNPVALNELTKKRNRAPRVMGVGGFVRTVKEIKQIKAHHLSKVKPSALYYEFILHQGFADGSIVGDSWAEITASAISYVASRLATAASVPVCDPVLDQPYEPLPSPADLETARSVFDGLASRARRAVTTDDRCQAGLEWRHIFGSNGRDGEPHAFPQPTGCRGAGLIMGAAGSNLALGGTVERSFGQL